MAMTIKMRRFIDAYLETWEGKRAAEIAGYKNAKRAAWRIMQVPEVQDEIERRMAEAGLRANEVLARLAEQARINIADFIIFDTLPVYDELGNWVGENKTFTLNTDIIKDKGHLIKRIKNTRYGPEIELHDSQIALIQVGKAIGALTERIDITSQGNQIQVNFYIPQNGREQQQPDA